MKKYIFKIIVIIVIILNISSQLSFVLAKTIETDENVKINSHIGLIYDRESGRVLYEKNGYEEYKMASTTKIMTAIIVIENCNINDIVIIDKKAAGTGGSRLGLKTNDKITVIDLLYGLMLESGNDAAVALANYTSGGVEEFAALMNKKAQELGLSHTNFVVPHGLDNNNHYTTAYELAIVTDYALKNEIFRNIVKTKTYNIKINGRSKTISNTNELLGYLDGVYGVKTGFTNGAGRCLVTACKREKLDIITIVLGADTKKTRTSDSIKLIEYANKNYETVDINKMVTDYFEKWKEENINKIKIIKGQDKQIGLILNGIKYSKMALTNEEKDNIVIKVNNIFEIEAPVKEKYKLGEVIIGTNECVIERLDIITANEIKRKNIKDYFYEILGLIY